MKNKKINNSKKFTRAAMGAAFLMAMAAVGPGFLTQTATFTGKLGSNFAFAILICILIDIIVQLNIWRIIIVSGKRAQIIANQVFPGLGYILSFLVSMGGLFFNIGNIGGAGLGLNVLLGISPENGAIIVAFLIVFILTIKKALKAMDITVQILAIIKIGILIFILSIMTVPYHAAALHTFAPSKINFYSILTIVGGTVGGYISFSGGHRLLEGGVSGIKNIKYVNQGALTGIGLASIIRIMLFLAGLAVVIAGYKLNPDNPAASIFKYAAGNFGYKFFGLLLFASGMSSTLGSTFTSVSFLDYGVLQKNSTKFKSFNNKLVLVFIIISTLIFYFVGNPAKILVTIGALNGLILPISLGILLLASKNSKIIGNQYHHPLWLSFSGWVVVIFMAYASIRAIFSLF